MTLKNRLIDLHNKIMGLPNFKLVVLMLILKIIVTAIVFPLFYIFPLEQSVYDSFDTSLVYQNAGIAQILYLVFNICNICNYCLLYSIFFHVKHITNNNLN